MVIFWIECQGIEMFGLIFDAYVDNEKLTRHALFNNVTSCSRNCRSRTYCLLLDKEAIRAKVIPRRKLEDLGPSKELADSFGKRM